MSAPPLVLRSIADVTAWCRSSAQSTGFVPTMGFLHEGHLSLMREARRRTDRVLVSIFVNPMQFGPKEDLARYPRDLEGDLAKCASAGVDAVFVPEPSEMYPEGFQTGIDVTDLSRGLCGEKRPGHFRGVATVVTKLFNIVRPEKAFFGEKDYQQLQVIRRVAQDLNLGVDVVGLPTVRESDGLAKSSRNTYLTTGERQRAVALFQGLEKARQLFAAGERDARELVQAIRGVLEGADIRVDYVEIVHPSTLRALSLIPEDGTARILLAGYVGTTRLIDNAAVCG